jgi:hypothetical protein
VLSHWSVSNSDRKESSRLDHILLQPKLCSANKYSLGRLEYLLHSLYFIPTSETPPSVMDITIKQTVRDARIWGSHSRGYEEFYLLAYNVVQSTESLPMFQKNMLPPHAVMNSMPSKKPTWCKQKAFLRLFFNPADEDNIFLQDVSWLSTDYMTIHPRTLLLR